MVDLYGAGAELSQHAVQRSVRRVVALVKAVDDVSQLEDELWSDSRLGPTFLGISQQLQAAPVVPLPRPRVVEPVVEICVLNVSYHAECKKWRLLTTVAHPRCLCADICVGCETASEEGVDCAGNVN